MLAVGSALEIASPGPGRPSKTDSFRTSIELALTACPTLRTTELLAQARALGYQGGKSALYALVAEVRETIASRSRTNEDRPGAVTEHDLGTFVARTPRGSRLRLSFVVTRSPYSDMVLATLVEDLAMNRIVKALRDHFATLGGLPLLAIFMHERIVREPALRASRPTWRLDLAREMLELGVGLDFKAPVEIAARGADLCERFKKRFLCRRAFLDEVAASAAVSAAIAERNAVEVSERRAAEERARLRPMRCSGHP